MSSLTKRTQRAAATETENEATARAKSNAQNEATDRAPLGTTGYCRGWSRRRDNCHPEEACRRGISGSSTASDPEIPRVASAPLGIHRASESAAASMVQNEPTAGGPSAKARRAKRTHREVSGGKWLPDSGLWSRRFHRAACCVVGSVVGLPAG